VALIEEVGEDIEAQEEVKVSTKEDKGRIKIKDTKVNKNFTNLTGKNK
jgi:hypothetical protein